MKWIEPKHSKGKVRKAGKYLLENIFSKDENIKKQVYQSYDVLSNWRASHAYPMHTVLMLLRRKVKNIDKNAVVVQRLKRTLSIMYKLRRFKSMCLDRMQDIAGCRVILGNVDRVLKFNNLLRVGGFTHLYHSSKDYIKYPKESGYRGIHLVYKYNASKGAYKNMFIEVQLRSIIQHSWATAVEVVDAFTKQALKASIGEEDWKDFFKFVSVEFARLEKCSTGINISKENCLRKIKQLINKLDIHNKLNLFAITSKHIDRKGNKGDLFILYLDAEAKQIRITQFEKKNLKDATEQYLKLERTTKENPLRDVVLVSADSIKELKKAYPNYFADTKIFVQKLNSIFK